MADTVQIRQMDSFDVDDCARITADNILWQRYGVDFCSAQKRFQTALDKDASILVALVDEEISGFCWYHLKAAFNRSGYIQMIGVDPQKQGLGIGQELLVEAEKLVSVDSDDMFLTVSDFNLAAQRFYRRCGYEQIGVIPDYVISGINELLMRKQLKK